MNQQGDIVFYQTDNGGEIDVNGGVVTMDGGLYTAVYLSLFGGPEDGSEWWGNTLSRNETENLTGHLQSLTRGIPLISSNLRRIEDAALLDLAWLERERITSSISVTARIEQRNRLAIDVEIAAYGEESRFRFTEVWGASGPPPSGLTAPPGPIDVYATTLPYPILTQETMGASGDVQGITLKQILRRYTDGEPEEATASGSVQSITLQSVQLERDLYPVEGYASGGVDSITLKQVQRFYEDGEPEEATASGDVQSITLKEVRIPYDNADPEIATASGSVQSITLKQE